MHIINKAALTLFMIILISTVAIGSNNSQAIFLKTDESQLSITYKLQLNPSQSLLDNIIVNRDCEVAYYIEIFKTNQSTLVPYYKIAEFKKTYFINYDKTTSIIKIYNDEGLNNFSDFSSLFAELSNKKFERIYKIKQNGIYFTRCSFSLITVKLFPPFSFFLFFINVYNISIENIDSNIVNYE